MRKTYVSKITEEGGTQLKDDKIKELFKRLDILEKLIVKAISIAGWVKILIDIFSN